MFPLMLVLVGYIYKKTDLHIKTLLKTVLITKQAVPKNRLELFVVNSELESNLA